MNILEFRFVFRARNFERSLEFYQGSLSMHYIRGWNRPDSQGALLQAGENTLIEIFGVPEGQAYTEPVGISLALRLDSEDEVDEWYDRLSEKGEDVGDLPQAYPWGQYSFTVYDPDGIPITIYCEIEDV
jgi:uncharacterized glyoxalase superfamily protein PhnB